MSVRGIVFIATLAWVAPVLAASKTQPVADVAQALAASQSEKTASGGSCCGGSGGGSCADAPKPGEAPGQKLNPFASEENWKEFVRQTFAAPPPEEEEEPLDLDPFAFGVYRGVRPEPMGTQTLINGASMEIASLIVEDPPHVVMKFYERALEKAGISQIKGQVEEVPGMIYLSFRPRGSKKLRTITLVPHGEGTVILVSVANPEELIEGRPALPDNLPLPPNAEFPTAIQQLEPGLASRSALFVVRDSSVEKVNAFYREELLRRGFEPVTVQDGLPGMESYQKGPLLLSISAKPHTEPSSVAVGLLWIEE